MQWPALGLRWWNKTVLIQGCCRVFSAFESRHIVDNVCYSQLAFYTLQSQFTLLPYTWYELGKGSFLSTLP